MRENGMQMKERAMGAMAGLALGDALGMPTQSMSAKQIRRYYDGPITKLMNAVPQQPIAPNMKAGAVTDDTEQAFVLARRLIDDNGCIDNTRYAHDLLQWEAAMKAKGSLDLLGPSTKAALQKTYRRRKSGRDRPIRHHHRRCNACHAGGHRIPSRPSARRRRLAILCGDA